MALKALPPKFGLTGVWMGFGVLNLPWLSGVGVHPSIMLCPQEPSIRSRLPNVLLSRKLFARRCFLMLRKLLASTQKTELFMIMKMKLE